MKKFISGFISGAILFSVAGALAASFTANPNPFPIKLNGNDVTIEGYNIEGSTYFKLRDIADVLGGFEVGFDDGTITLTTPDNKPEQTAEPTQAPSSTVTEPLPDVPIHTIDGVDYVYKPEIEKMLDDIGLNKYEFGVWSFVNTDDYSTILDDIPYYDILYIPYDYYQETIVPIINSLK